MPPLLDVLRLIRDTGRSRFCRICVRLFKCVCVIPLLWLWRGVRCLASRLVCACVDQVLVYVAMAILIVYFVSSEASARLGTPTLSDVLRIEDPGTLVYQGLVRQIATAGSTYLPSTNHTDDTSGSEPPSTNRSSSSEHVTNSSYAPPQHATQQPAPPRTNRRLRRLRVSSTKQHGKRHELREHQKNG